VSHRTDRITRNLPETPVQPLLLSTEFEEICNKYVCPRVIGGERLGGAAHCASAAIEGACFFNHGRH
jgi:hypothetical protein